MQRRIRWLLVVTPLLLLAALLRPLAHAEPSAEAGLSTPQLIEAARDRGELDQETAYLYLAYALLDHEKLPATYQSNVPWSGTLPLMELQEAVPALETSAERAEIEQLLVGVCSDSDGGLPNVQDSTHFHVQYGAIGGGLNIDAYVASVETSWQKEITEFGWAAPPVLASNPPPGNRYHVRIDDLGSGLYGFVSNQGTHAGLVGNNPNTPWDDVDALASCMALNNDFSGFPGSPQRALDATTAHEFNHSIQFGYGAISGANRPDAAFIEGGATWMEDEVFDASDDNYNYLWPTFTTCMGQYPTSPYPYWITWRGLTERFGTGTAGAGEDVMQRFWELTSQASTSNELDAMNAALQSKGSSLAAAYHDYAIAVKFNKPCGGGYALPYCFEEAAGYVAGNGPTAVQGTVAGIGSSYNGSVQNNYALNWVALPTGATPYGVTLQNTSTGGQMRGSVVCDTGTTLRVGAMGVAAAGASVNLDFNPAGCTSIVAVITNQEQTAANPGSCTAQSYTVAVGAVTAVTVSDIAATSTTTQPWMPLLGLTLLAGTLGLVIAKRRA